MSSHKIQQDLFKLKNHTKAKILQRFFKTGPGEYGEGDVFLGIVMPKQRIVAKKYIDTPLKEIQKLLHSKIHEHRMVALLILTYQYHKIKKSPEGAETFPRLQEIFDFYLKNTKHINNWDLVDVTCPNIVGEYLLYQVETPRRGVSVRDDPRQMLYRLSRSKNLWERRIAIVSTHTFIRHNQFTDTLEISKILLNDPHNLIHKAVGWMLREVGTRNQEVEEKFLNRYYKTMPRTTLRYAIERFDQKKREFYMKK